MFDITKHEWSHSGIVKVYSDTEYVEDHHLLLSLEAVTPSLTINKDDAIAIARHFGLIGGNISTVPKDSISCYGEYCFIVGDIISSTRLFDQVITADLGDTLILEGKS